MAIVQSSLVENILSRQERAVIRGIYRASQLNDALSTLMNIIDQVYISSQGPQGPMANVPKQVVSLRDYLQKAVSDALVSTKVSASARASKEQTLTIESDSKPS